MPRGGSRRLLGSAALLFAGVALVGGALAARQPVRAFLARRDVGQARELVAAGRGTDARAALHRALLRKPDLTAARQTLGGLELATAIWSKRSSSSRRSPTSSR